MGDRVNIAIKDHDKRVYFYGHWSGYSAPETVRAALARGKSRWSDPSYLARIVFCEFVKGANDSTTGFGISTKIGDNEHPIIIVDCDKQQVYAEPERRGEIKGEAKRWTFAEYAALDAAEWKHLDSFR